MIHQRHTKKRRLVNDLKRSFKYSIILRINIIIEQCDIDLKTKANQKKNIGIILISFMDNEK